MWGGSNLILKSSKDPCNNPPELFFGVSINKVGVCFDTWTKSIAKVYVLTLGILWPRKMYLAELYYM